MSRRPLPLLLLVLLLGCGGEATDGPRAGVGPSLDADNLAVVHDELYACLRTELPGALLANYLGGQASITHNYGRFSFDERLAAPEAESALLEAGRAEFIGVRANRRERAQRGMPEWDILILPTAADAEQAAAEIARERGRTTQEGIFVRVVKRAGGGQRARAAEAALTRCLQRSRRD